MTETEFLNRLQKLERDNRRFKRLGFIALVLAAALCVTSATRPVPQKITAREFDVVDGTGKVRIRLWVQKDGTAEIGIRDTSGFYEAAMSWNSFLGPGVDLGFHKVRNPSPGLPHGSAVPDIIISDQPRLGPAITLSRGGLVGPSVNLGVTPSGQPNVVLADSKGIERADISLAPGGSPQLGFFSEAGRETVRLMTAENGSSLEFIGSQNQKIGKFSFPVDRMQLSTWGLYFDDKDGTSAISLGGVNPGHPDTPARDLSLYDAKGDERAAVSVNQGMPTVKLSDPQGYVMTLGSSKLVAPRTGETSQTSADSITMFANDNKHHVIWRAP